MPTEVVNLGFDHFVAQSDAITKFLFIVLIVMSVISWMIIFLKAMQAFMGNLKTNQFLKQYHKMENIDDAINYVKAHSVSTAHDYLLHSGLSSSAQYHSKGGHTLSDDDKEAFLTSVLRTKLDEIQLKIENGTSALATVAATAPFVGLFGTVWGIYHALIEIGSTGAGTIDKVAGPVGEALIMTGVGLAVAIPAVIAYNWISRRNRIKMGQLDSYAFELLTFLKIGSKFTSSR